MATHHARPRRVFASSPAPFPGGEPSPIGGSIRSTSWTSGVRLPNDITNLITAAGSNGMRFGFRLIDPPDWAGGSPARIAPADLEDYVFHVVRYAHASLAYFELFNEQNLGFEWGGTPDPAGYAPLMAAAYLVDALRMASTEYAWVQGATVFNLDYAAVGSIPASSEQSWFSLLNPDKLPRAAFSRIKQARASGELP